MIVFDVSDFVGNLKNHLQTIFFILVTFTLFDMLFKRYKFHKFIECITSWVVFVRRTLCKSINLLSRGNSQVLLFFLYCIKSFQLLKRMTTHVLLLLLILLLPLSECEGWGNT